MKCIPSPIRQPRTKGWVSFLEFLRCAQIGLPPERVYIYMIRRLRVDIRTLSLLTIFLLKFEQPHCIPGDISEIVMIEWQTL